jgi:adenylate cyclase
MPQKPNKLSRFWQELKRRRVIHVITVYASASFVIIDLVGNLKEPLNLPPLLPTILIIILAVGFPLAVLLSWIYDLTSEGIEKTKPLSEIREEKRTAVPNAWKVATYVSFVVIIGLVSYNIVTGTRSLHPGDIQSLAILPFNNLTGDEQLDWAAAAMHSILNGDMGKVGGLRVLSNTTSKAIKDANMTVPDIAERYNLDALLEGTLTCYGDMVCTQFKVINTYPEEKVLWTEEYMVEKNQLLIFNSQIIKKIAQKLKIRLTPQEETLLAESMVVDPEAYDAYLGGRYMLDQANPQSLTAAIDSFKKAVEIEPAWAAPYAGLAEVGAMKNHFELGSASDNLPMTYENLNKALELDPNSVGAHYTKALTAFEIEFDWGKAEKEFLTAIDLNPSHVRSHGFYADMLSKLRRTDEALYHGKISEELDPENPFTLTIYAFVLKMNGKCQEALYYLEKGLSIDPDNLILAQLSIEIYACLGDYEKAFAVWKGMANPFWEEYGVAALFERVFRERGWIALIKEVIRADEEVWKKDGRTHVWSLAGRYVIVGKYDKAMDIYETFYNNTNHYTRLQGLSAKSFYEKMKGNQRYLALLEKLNLPTSDD